MSPHRRSRTSATRATAFIPRLLPLLAFQTPAMAQTPATDAPAAAQASSTLGGTMAGVVIEVTILLVVLSAIGVGVKLYDLKRRREVAALPLPSRIADALLLKPSLAVLPIVTSLSGSFWPRSSVLVTVTGSVPTPAVRAAVMRLVERELLRRQYGARAVDRLVIDPLMGKHVA